ncbi:MAG: riboflavin synthase [Ignavibacteriae bacterium]|nr:riboflavin synthase [Ignavibacteriota bacterium]
MFTGIIEEVGTIQSVQRQGGGIRFRVSAPKYSPELKVNDSVSINGACHTVVWRSNDTFDVESVEETLKKTTLGSLQTGSRVNLELPMRLNERLGGHLVLGHVDTVGTIKTIVQRGNSTMYSIEIPEQFKNYIIPVGSIAIDGVSLTIAEIEESVVRVSIIPHTLENTIFQQYKNGTMVNLEFDLIGKYIERMMSETTGEKKMKSSLTEVYLREEGF